MADRAKKEGPELLPPIKQEDKNRAIQEAQSFPPSVSPFSTPSRIPFVNKLRKKSIQTYTEVIKAENELFSALSGHSLMKGRLRDIDVEIETEHIDRVNKLRDAERIAKQAEQQDELADLDMQVQIAEMKKRLSEVNKEAEPPKSQAEKWEEECQAKEEELRHKSEMDRLYKKDKVRRMMDTDDVKKDMAEEITERFLKRYNVKRVTQLPPEAIQELEEQIEDMEDILDPEKEA